MAPRARIVSQWFSDVITNTPAYVTDYNMIATNNSYTAADDGCIGNGVYDVLSNYADAQMRAYEKCVARVFGGQRRYVHLCALSRRLRYGQNGLAMRQECADRWCDEPVGLFDREFQQPGPIKDCRLKPEIVASAVLAFIEQDITTHTETTAVRACRAMAAR